MESLALAISQIIIELSNEADAIYLPLGETQHELIQSICPES